MVILTFKLNFFKKNLKVFLYLSLFVLVLGFFCILQCGIIFVTKPHVKRIFQSFVEANIDFSLA